MRVKETQECFLCSTQPCCFQTLLKLYRTNWIPAREVNRLETHHLHLNLISSLFFSPHLPVRCSKILSIVQGLERIPDICVALKVVYHIPSSVCVCVCVSCFSHFKLYVSLWTVAHQAPLPMEFSRQEYWSGSPFLYPGDLPDPGIEHTPLMSPALAGGVFTMAPPGKPTYPIVPSCKWTMFHWFEEWDFWIIWNRLSFSSSIHFYKCRQISAFWEEYKSYSLCFILFPFLPYPE